MPQISTTELIAKINTLLDALRRRSREAPSYLDLPKLLAEWRKLRRDFDWRALTQERLAIEQDLRTCVRAIQLVYPLTHSGATPPPTLLWSKYLSREQIYRRFFMATRKLSSIESAELKQHTGKSLAEYLQQYNKWQRLWRREQKSRAQFVEKISEVRKLLYIAQGLRGIRPGS